MVYTACAPPSSDGAFNELLQSWGQDIAAARQSMGLSQSACASCLFLSEETIRGLEAGDPRIGLGAFVTVLWALGLVDDLDGPLAPVERKESPVFLPAKIPEWQVSRLPVLVRVSDLTLAEEVLPPRWPHELWALEDVLSSMTSHHARMNRRDFYSEGDEHPAPLQLDCWARELAEFEAEWCEVTAPESLTRDMQGQESQEPEIKAPEETSGAETKGPGVKAPEIQEPEINAAQFLVAEAPRPFSAKTSRRSKVGPNPEPDWRVLFRPLEREEMRKPEKGIRSFLARRLKKVMESAGWQSPHAKQKMDPERSVRSGLERLRASSRSGRR